MIKQKKEYKFKLHTEVENIWNWKCWIVERGIDGRGENVYWVESAEDESFDSVDGIHQKRWLLKEIEILRKL